MTIYVSFPGRASDMNVFGGTPYHFAESLRHWREDTAYLDIPNGGFVGAVRYGWNLLNLFALRGTGGFQYSDFYLNLIWRNVPALTRDDTIVSLFQLVGRQALASPARKVFYIDQTLRALFEDYGVAISANARRDAVAAERRNYELADLVVCRSAWAANDVVTRYGISESKVKVVIPGANVPEAFTSFFETRPPQPVDGPLRFLFIGKDPLRKGLFRFLDAVKLLGPNVPVRIDVAGFAAEDLPAAYRDMPGLAVHGFVDKKNDIEKFCGLLRDADIGILLSTAEAGGFSLREFQMAGLGVFSPDVGGSPEWVAAGAGELFGAEATAQDIAAAIRRLSDEPQRVQAMKDAAWAAREDMNWDRAAREFSALLEGL